jgi:hypothetical protein
MDVMITKWLLTFITTVIVVLFTPSGELATQLHFRLGYFSFSLTKWHSLKKPHNALMFTSSPDSFWSSFGFPLSFDVTSSSSDDESCTFSDGSSTGIGSDPPFNTLGFGLLPENVKNTMKNLTDHTLNIYLSILRHLHFLPLLLQVTEFVVS